MALTRVLLLTLVAGTLAVPTPERTTRCARTCAGTGKFSYEAGKTYEYQYESDLKTLIAGSTEEQSGLHLTATVQLEVLSQCDLALRLSDVSLEDSHPSQQDETEHVDQAWDFKRALQEKPLRFSFQDGHVEELCPDAEEETWVLNIKRGILSAIQNTMPSLDSNIKMMETDVAGICPVEYEVLGSSWGVHKIKKIKDILACRERHGFETAFQASPYKVQSKVQSLPLLKTTHECEQELNSNGLLVRAECTEEHLFRPFSKHHSGALTQVNYKLTYHRENSDVRTQESWIQRRESLLFEHVPTAEEMNQNQQAATDTLREICVKTSNDIRPEVPGLFVQLVQQLRQLDAATLGNLHRTVRTNQPCESAQTFFRDAVPMLGSTASISLIRDLITSGEAKDTEADLWLTSMAFIKTPTAEMLTQIRPLLDITPGNRKAYLSISSLVNTYCHADENCGEEAGVQSVIRKLEENLRYNCRSASDEEYDMVMMSLKSIGNAGRAEQTVPTLNRCIMSEENPMEIRIAAVQAFRRMGCSADHSEIMNVFKNPDLCSELRINAYLAVMQCPSSQVLSEIRETLEQLQINQVGSFVWTHLTNLRESSDPHKQEIRQILENVELKKAFDMDKRKFSRNIEWSAFSEMVNTGAKVESNLIWSTKSYIPRSAMVNLTVDVFGQSLNLIEMGGRADGLENMLENFFGPSKEASPVNRFESTYSVMRKDKPAGSYYLKIFGNEIRYDDFRDLDLSSLKDRFNYLDWLIRLADQHDFDVKKSVMFLDTSMVVPTGVGMPLKLSVDGTAVMDVKVQGRIDLRKIATSPRGLHIGGSVKPSAAIQVNSHMGVDAHVVKTGLKMSSTLHTSTVTDGLIELRDGRIFNMDINVPQDKIEIFSAETKFYLTFRGVEREQEMLTDDRVEMAECVAGKLVKALGIELCGEISFPQSYVKSSAPWFPLTGPAKAKVFINKRDTYTGFHVEARYQPHNARNGETDTAKFSFNTPGSRYDREITVDYSLNRPAKTMLVNVKTPWKKADFTGVLVLEDQLKQLTARTMVDDTLEYLVTSEVQIEDKRFLTEYRPKFEVSIPNRPRMVALTGTVGYRKQRKLEVDFNLESPMSRQPLQLKGELNGVNNAKRTKYEGSIEFVSDTLSGKFSGLSDIMRAESSIYKQQANLEYTWTGQRKETFVVTNKVIAEVYKHLNIESEVTTSMWPQYDSRGSVDVVKEGSTINGNVQGSWGQNPNQRLSITSSANYELDTPTKSASGELNFQFPYKGLDYTMKVEHMRSPSELKSMASATYGNGREAVFDIHLKKESMRPVKVSAEVRLRYPGRDMSLVDTIEERATGQYHHDLNLRLDQDTNIVVNSVYKRGPQHELTTDITTPYIDPIHIEGHLKPTLTDFDTAAKVLVGRQEYGMAAAWTHRGGVNNFNTRGNGQVVYPQRTVTVSATANRRGNNLEGNVETSWGPGKKIDVGFTLNKLGRWSNVKSSLSLSTPFPAVQMAKGEVEYNYQPGSITTTTSGQWNNYRVALATTGTGNLRRHILDGEATLTSNIPGMEELTLKGSHNDNGRAFNTELDVGWAPNQKVNGKFHMIHDREGWTISNNGELTIETSFNHYETNKFTWNHQNGDGRSTCHYELEVRRQRHTLDISATNSAVNGRDLALTTTLSSPLCEEVSVEFTHHNDRAGFRNIKTDAVVKYGSRIFSVSNELDVVPRRMLKGKLNLVLPYRRLQQISLDMNNMRQGHQLTINNELKWNTNQKVAIDGSYTRNGYDVDGNLRLTTPFAPVERVRIAVSNKQEQGLWVSMGELNYGEAERIVLNTKVGMDTPKKLTIDLATPYDYVRAVNLDIQHRGNVRDFDTTVEFSHNMIQGKITSNAKLNTVNVRDINGLLTFSTPFQKQALQSSTITLQHKMQGRNVFKTDIGYRNPGLDVAASNVITANGWKDHSSHSEITYGPGRTIELEHMFTTRPTIKGKLEFKSPYPNLELISLTFDHDVRPGRINSVTVLKMPVQGYETTTLTIDHTRSPASMHSTGTLEVYGRVITSLLEYNKNGQTITGKYELSAPNFSEYFDNLVATFTHNGGLTNFRNNGEVQYMGRTITGNSEFNLNGANLNGKLEIATPYDMVRSVSLAVNHEGEWTDFRNTGTLVYNGQTGTHTTQFKKDGGKVTGKMEVSTPFRGYESMAAEFEHTGRLTNFRNSGSVQVLGNTYTGATELKKWGNNLVASVEVKVPDEYSISIKHKGKPMDFSNVLNIKYAGRRINVNSNFEHKDNKVSLTSNIRTPFRGYDNMAVSFTHEGDLSSFTTQGKIESPRFNNMGFEVSHSGNLRDFTSSGKVDLPFDALPSVSGRVTHRGTLHDFESTGNIEYLGKTITANGNYRNNGQTIVAAGTVETPYNNMEKTGFSFNNEGTLNNFRARGNIETSVRGYDRFAANINHNGSPENFRTVATIESPFPSMPSATVNLNHRGNLNDFTSTGSVEYNNKRVEGEATFKRNPTWHSSDYELGLKVNTPYDQIRSGELKYEHHRQGTSNTGLLDVTHNGVKKVDMDYSYSMGETHSAQTNIRAPRPMSAAVNYADTGSAVNADATLSYGSSNARVNVGLVNEDSKREFMLKAILPHRTVGATLGYTRTPTGFSHNGELQWDRSEDKKITYMVEGNVNQRRGMALYDGLFQLHSLYANVEGTVTHRCSPGSSYTTEVSLTRPETITFKHEATIQKPAYNMIFTVQHPRLTKDATLNLRGTYNRESRLYDGQATAEYEDQLFEMAGKLADESRADIRKYVMEASAKHPNSKLDAQVTGSLENTRQLINGNLDFKYMMTREQQYKTLSIRTEINKLRKELDMQILTPTKTIQVNGRKSIEDVANGIHHYMMTGTMDQHNFRAEAGINRQERGAELKLHLNPDHMIHVYGKYMDPRTVQMEAYAERQGQKTQHALLSIHLNENRMLNTRTFVRPDLYNDIKQSLSGTSFDTTLLDEGIEALVADGRYKIYYLQQAGTPFTNGLQRVAQDLTRWSGQLQAAYGTMYNNNEFYMKDMANVLGQWGYKIQQSTGYTTEMVSQKMAEWARMWRARGQRLAESVASSYRENMERVTDQMNDGMEYARQMTPDIPEQFIEYSDQIAEQFSDAMDQVRPRMEVFREWLRSLKISDRMQALVDKVEDAYDWVMTYPEAQAVRQFLVDALEKTKWAAEYFEIRERVKHCLNDLYRTGGKLIKARLYDTALDYTHFDQNRFIKRGEGDVEMELFVPFPLANLKSLPKFDFNLRQRVIRFRNWVNQYFPETSNWKLWDTYYAYKPSRDYLNWVPPFKAHAVLTGNQHYMTFDKKFYAFKGDCSYLLANDFIDGRFTVVVNYQAEGGTTTKKSITVTSNGKSVEIFPDSKIMLDGRRVEMPIHFDNTTICREGNRIILENTKGITVTCDLPYDTCTLNVTGWYFGKTAGLFGTYDNEPATDFTMQNKRRTSDVAEFAASWGVGRQCQVQNDAMSSMSNMAADGSEHYESCATYFTEPSSPYSACFRHIDNNDVMTMCLSTPYEEICKVHSLYVSECSTIGMPVSLPNQCVKCETPSGQSYQQGAPVTLEAEDGQNPTTQSADVVLVVDHQACNREVVDKLKDMVDTLEKSFRAKGMRDNRYGLVGYGGEGVVAAPHSHTMEGQVFNSKDKFQLGLENFEITETEDSDAMRAVEFATRYPFRHGVSKTIILMPCTSCMEAGTSYSQIQEALLISDIRFHVLLHENFRMRARSPKIPVLFGVDKDGVFTPKSVNDDNMEGDRDLRTQLLMPKDICAALTEETDGSIFDIRRLTDSRTTIQKKFIDVFSRLVAKKALPTTCQICDCVADQTGVGKSVCTSCIQRDPIHNLYPQFDEESAESEESEETNVPSKSKSKNKSKKNRRPKTRNAKTRQRN